VKTTLATAVIATLLATSAWSGTTPGHRHQNVPQAPPVSIHSKGGPGVPEIDPAAIGALASLLVGGALLLQSGLRARKLAQIR
jgi:hypothetical protein